MTMLRLLYEDTSRKALCQEVPGSLLAEANGVLTSARGVPAVDAVPVAAFTGVRIGDAFHGKVWNTNRPLLPDFKRTLPHLVAALAASLAVLVCSPGITELPVCRPGQHLGRYDAGDLMGRCASLAAQLSAACCRLRQQLQLSVPSGLDRAEILTCSRRAGKS